MYHLGILYGKDVYLKSGSNKEYQTVGSVGAYTQPAVLYMIRLSKYTAIYNGTVEPLNKGHFGSRGFVLFSEVVLWWEVQSIRSFIDLST